MENFIYPISDLQLPQISAEENNLLTYKECDQFFIITKRREQLTEEEKKVLGNWVDTLIFKKNFIEKLVVNFNSDFSIYTSDKTNDIKKILKSVKKFQLGRLFLDLKSAPISTTKFFTSISQLREIVGNENFKRITRLGIWKVQKDYTYLDSFDTFLPIVNIDILSGVDNETGVIEHENGSDFYVTFYDLRPADEVDCRNIHRIPELTKYVKWNFKKSNLIPEVLRYRLTNDNFWEFEYFNNILKFNKKDKYYYLDKGLNKVVGKIKVEKYYTRSLCTPIDTINFQFK